MTDHSVSRRHLLGAAATVGAVAMAGTVTACDTSPSSQGGAGKLTWWDHSPNLQAANHAAYAEWKKVGGLDVDYTYIQTAKIGQSLQLAKQSNQLPDVTVNVGLNLPLPNLISDNWFQPLQLTDEARKKLDDAKVLFEGIHTFEGKLYSFPIQSPKQFWSANWFNTNLMAKADLDPANPPTTFQEFRDAGKKIMATTKGSYAWIANIGMTDRMATQVHHLATAAGFQGMNGTLFHTGEFAVDSEPYLQVLEFLLSLNTDKMMMPGSISFDDKIARQRWATGIAGFYFDGPWCPGVVIKDAKAFMSKIGVGGQVMPQPGMRNVAYAGPQGGVYWTTGSSKIPDKAGQLLSLQTSATYQQAIATGMAQPPQDVSVVAQSDAHESYKKLIGLYQRDAFLGPTPVVRNPDVAKVDAANAPIKPTFGDIIQGAFSGDVADWRKALTDYSAKVNAQRADGIKKVNAKGGKVSADDYAFPDWKPRQDFTAEMYK